MFILCSRISDEAISMYRYPILVVSQTLHGTEQVLLGPLHFHVENAASVRIVFHMQAQNVVLKNCLAFERRVEICREGKKHK